MDQRIAELGRVFAALGSTERIRIVSYLLSQEGTPCGRIAHALGMSTSAFSYHLRILQNAGLVKRSRDGRFHCLSVTPLLQELLTLRIRNKLAVEGRTWTSKSSTK